MNALFSKNVDGKDVSTFVLEHIEKPIPSSHGILVNVKNVAVSNVDISVLKDIFKNQPQHYAPLSLEIAGFVVDCGDDVTKFKKGDRVAGFVPLDSEFSCFAQYCLLDEWNTVPIADNVSFPDIVCTLGDGVKAFTALHYLAHVGVGDTVVILDPLSMYGCLLIQLAHEFHAAKVIVVVTGKGDSSLLDRLSFPSSNIIETNSRLQGLCNQIMQNTGGMGADVIIDCGDNTAEFSDVKHDIISSLAVNGRWITCYNKLQLDPPDCRLLYLKCASVNFLFEHTWTLATAKQGRFQHILQAIMKLLQAKKLIIFSPDIIDFADVCSNAAKIYPQTVNRLIISFSS